MIARDMKEYPFYLLSNYDGYGQQTRADQPSGTITAAIYERNKTVSDSVLYTDAEYIAITPDTLPDSAVIDYNGQALKVLYTMARGSLKQSFLKAGGAL